MSSIEDLSVTFNQKLLFNEDINKIKNKALTELGCITRCCINFNNPNALKIFTFHWFVPKNPRYKLHIFSNSVFINNNCEIILCYYHHNVYYCFYKYAQNVLLITITLFYYQYKPFLLHLSILTLICFCIYCDIFRIR